jgi:hypothetical protein
MSGDQFFYYRSMGILLPALSTLKRSHEAAGSWTGQMAANRWGSAHPPPIPGRDDVLPGPNTKRKQVMEMHRQGYCSGDIAVRTTGYKSVVTPTEATEATEPTDPTDPTDPTVASHRSFAPTLTQARPSPPEYFGITPVIFRPSRPTTLARWADHVAARPACPPVVLSEDGRAAAVCGPFNQRTDPTRTTRTTGGVV